MKKRERALVNHSGASVRGDFLKTQSFKSTHRVGWILIKFYESLSPLSPSETTAV